ncbi:hypothetical protein [Burkholderia alba]|uniref:hypothetical protein n=1 Tax=Burkholderia alba TaxID=2683677 RepID=UPI002B05AF8F|nr:hypothetical protein [Burkholderia alba]
MDNVLYFITRMTEGFLDLLWFGPRTEQPGSARWNFIVDFSKNTALGAAFGGVGVAAAAYYSGAISWSSAAIGGMIAGGIAAALTYKRHHGDGA